MGETFARAGLPIGPDRRPDQQFFERSDNIAFARLGVPAHTLSSYNMHDGLPRAERRPGARRHPAHDRRHPRRRRRRAPARRRCRAALERRTDARVARSRRRPTPTPLPVSPAASRPRRRPSVLAKFTTVKLEADTASLTRDERRMLPLLIDAAREMHDDILGAGHRPARLRAARRFSDPAARRLAEIKVGPWDRLDDNAPFVRGVGPKPRRRQLLSARHDQGGVRARGRRRGRARRQPQVAGTRWSAAMRRAGSRPSRTRGSSPPRNQRAAAKLRAAAALADDPGLRRYLHAARQRARHRQLPAERHGVDGHEEQPLDIVLGPIETYEDELFGYKAADESFVLVKDQAWSRAAGEVRARCFRRCSAASR